MKGLLLNQYYAAEKSIKYYVPISFAVACALLFFENAMAQRFAAFIPIVIIGTAALEVLKQESQSGWDKYVMTLPVKRNHVVQSHYVFFLLMTFTGLLIAGTTYVVGNFVFGQTPGTGFVYGVMDVLGITFTMGFVAYPLTYLLGTQKAEVVYMISGGGALGLFFLSAIVFELWIAPLNLFQGMNIDLMFSISYMTINFVLFLISYAVSILVYKRKEF
ncbi:ABC-2 transporter permease [Shouchella patagoniensis]|uniref:ABC-2 transporter permease n=1 Tax=Shouchella patagoniensis TaxID=228576 RepID=UPI000995315F|nr:ABC-2 transporter permease [Shouchella patagoniensis]